jgi:diguanylate cyclase (GGDEF)-like protein
MVGAGIFCRILCVAGIVAMLLFPAPVSASIVRFGEAVCHSVTRADATESTRFACKGEPEGYQANSLWLRIAADELANHGGDMVLMVHQTRFDRLSVVFAYADGVAMRQSVASGAFGSHWRVGGQIAFDAPVRSARLTDVTMRFDNLASHKLLRIRLISRDESTVQSSTLAALIGAALTLLAIGALYNLSLSAAIRRQFLGWHGAWAACVFLWGVIWSQIHLLALPWMAGATSAQMCTFLACLAIALATTSAATSLDRRVLPRRAAGATLTIGWAIGLAGIPVALERGPALQWMGDAMSIAILADLAAVAACLAWAWRRGSTEARDFAGAWAVPMAALALTQVTRLDGILWGGGSQILVLFAAAWQTIWLSVAATRRLSRLRVERDRARAAEAQAAELARRDPLTGLANRRGFIERAAPLVEQAAKEGAPVALLLLDVDRFKTINDVHGHDVGDMVLVTLADRLDHWEGSMCAVARMGGEEFALMTVGLDGLALERFAESVRRELAACDHSALLGDRVVTVSIGVTTAQGDLPDFPSLYRVADQALYSAKQLGRDRVVIERPRSTSRTERKPEPASATLH